MPPRVPHTNLVWMVMHHFRVHLRSQRAQIYRNECLSNPIQFQQHQHREQQYQLVLLSTTTSPSISPSETPTEGSACTTIASKCLLPIETTSLVLWIWLIPNHLYTKATRTPPFCRMWCFKGSSSCSSLGSVTSPTWTETAAGAYSISVQVSFRVKVRYGKLKANFFTPGTNNYQRIDCMLKLPLSVTNETSGSSSGFKATKCDDSGIFS